MTRDDAFTAVAARARRFLFAFTACEPRPSAAGQQAYDRLGDASNELLAALIELERAFGGNLGRGLEWPSAMRGAMIEEEVARFRARLDGADAVADAFRLAQWVREGEIFDGRHDSELAHAAAAFSDALRGVAA